MKSFIILLSLLGSLSVFADATVGANDSEIINGRINAAYIVDMQEGLQTLTKYVEKTINSLGEPSSHEEGRIQAVIINIIEVKLKELDKIIDEISMDSEIIDLDLVPYNDKIKEITTLLEQLTA